MAHFQCLYAFDTNNFHAGVCNGAGRIVGCLLSRCCKQTACQAICIRRLGSCLVLFNSSCANAEQGTVYALMLIRGNYTCHQLPFCFPGCHLFHAAGCIKATISVGSMLF